MPSKLQTIQKGRKQRPRRVLVYGTGGIGKSTFGAMAERPIFIPTEDGLGDIDCESFPLARTYEDVIDDLATLYSDPTEYRTAVVDSGDWLEKLIFARVCQDEGVTDIEQIPYAKGYSFALKYWREILSGLTALRDARGMMVILIAHARIERFDNPATDSYDRYVPALQKQAGPMLCEWCEEVLFANYSVQTKTTEQGFDRKRTQGLGGERVLYTTERPSHIAKNRLGLPDEIPLDYRVYDAYVRGEMKPPAEPEPEPQPEPEPTPEPTPESNADSPQPEPEPAAVQSNPAKQGAQHPWQP